MFVMLKTCCSCVSLARSLSQRFLVLADSHNELSAVKLCTSSGKAEQMGKFTKGPPHSLAPKYSGQISLFPL